MMTLNISLNNEFSKSKYEYILEYKKLIIQSFNKQYIVNRELEKIKAPIDLVLEYN